VLLLGGRFEGGGGWVGGGRFSLRLWGFFCYGVYLRVCFCTIVNQKVAKDRRLRKSSMYYHHRTNNSKYRLPWHKPIPPLRRRMLVRPAQQRIVVHAFMNRTPTGTSLGLTFERSVAGAHQRLADVVEAVRGMVSDFLREIRAAVALLEVLHEI